MEFLLKAIRLSHLEFPQADRVADQDKPLRSVSPKVTELLKLLITSI
jgi:hypothetical protein